MTIVEKGQAILDYRIKATFAKPVWSEINGRHQTEFEFSPMLEKYGADKPNIRWGSWGINYYYHIEIGPNIGNHLYYALRMLDKDLKAFGFQNFTLDLIKQ